MELTIKPEKVYIETLERKESQTPAVDNFLFHILIDNKTKKTITLKKMEIVFKNRRGVVSTRLFDKNILSLRIKESQPQIKKPDGSPAGVAKDLKLKPNRFAGIISNYFQEPSALRIDRASITIYGRDESGKVLREKKEVPLIRYTTKTELSLPFDGIWWIVLGHGIEEEHRLEQSQQFAYDFIKVGKDGSAFKDDGKRNKDHYCYGQPILAAGDGKVVKALDNISDNIPFEIPKWELPKDLKRVAGNYVIIDHLNGEFSFYAHLKPKSIRVRVGDKVKRGQKIGLCDNSGNSSGPHLHFQLADSPEIFKNIGLPIKFKKFYRYPEKLKDKYEGELIEFGTPYSRDFVANCPE